MSEHSRGPCGLFVGLVTLDLIYLADAPPAPNQKMSADDFMSAAGGPAANAAVAFAHLGGRARLAAALGGHRVADLVAADLAGCGVDLCDLAAADTRPPALSSIVVSRGSGERAVISRNAADRSLGATALDPLMVAAADVVLVDGHQMALAHRAAGLRGEAPLVVDAGSWKPGFDAVIRGADYVLCSADFRPPGCRSEAEVFAWLRRQGVAHAAISHGAAAVRWYGPRGSGELQVPQVTAIDTLGAGDFFHGAFCRYCLEFAFEQALDRAAAIASRSCTRFGTRAWMVDG